MTELGTDVDEFLKRIRQLGEQTDREDAQRAQALEQQIEEGRRRRQALRAQRARSQSPVKDGAATDTVKRDGDNVGTEDTPAGKRVTSRKEQEILSTIENLVGPTRTLSLFGKDESPSASKETPRMPKDVSKEVPQKETPGKSATGKSYEANTPQARFRETIQRHADWHESRLTTLGADSKPSTPSSATRDKSLAGMASRTESPSDTGAIKAFSRPERPEPRQKPASLAPRATEKSSPAPPLPGPRPSLRSQENSPAPRPSFKSQDSPVLRPSPSSSLRAAPGFGASPRPTSTPSASTMARANTLMEPRSAGRGADAAAAADDDDEDAGPPLPPRSSPSLARSPTTRHKAMAESLRALREKHARTNSSTSADGETSPALPPRPSLAPSPRGSDDAVGGSTPPIGTQRHSLHMGQAPSPSLGPAPASASPQQRSPSPTGLSRSPTRGGFVQSALKRDGTLRAARPASALLDGSVTPRMRPPVAPKPASAGRDGATLPSSDMQRALDPEPQLEAREAVREPVRDRLSRETSPADDDNDDDVAMAASSPSLSHSDSRRWSPARQTWLESALKRNPPANDGGPTRAGTLRSPSPSRPKSMAFEKPLPGSASTSSPRPASTVFDKSPLPTTGKVSAPTTPLTANKKPSLEPPTPDSTAHGTRDIQVDTPKRATPPPTVAKKPSLDAVASRGRSQQPDSEPEALQRLKTLRRSPDRGAAAAAAAAREAEEAEALQRLKSLRSGHSPERGSPASLARNQDTPEALQRLGSLRPGRSPERGSPAALVRNQDTPEALQRLGSLRPPKPPKPAPQQTAEAIEKLRALRPSSPTKTERIDESKITLERTISTLRPSRPEKHVPIDEVKVNLLSAKEHLHSPARGPSAIPEEVSESKPTPEPMPAPTPDRNKSRSFQDDLASALMRGPPPPPARGTSPALRKAATFDSADVARTDGGKLVHRTKTRARGPKRRLPTSATSSGAVSPEITSPVGAASGIAVAKTRGGQSGQPASKVAPPIRKSSRAVSIKNPPPKPRKPSSSIAN